MDRAGLLLVDRIATLRAIDLLYGMEILLCLGVAAVCWQRAANGPPDQRRTQKLSVWLALFAAGAAALFVLVNH